MTTPQWQHNRRWISRFSLHGPREPRWLPLMLVLVGVMIITMASNLTIGVRLRPGILSNLLALLGALIVALGLFWKVMPYRRFNRIDRLVRQHNRTECPDCGYSMQGLAAVRCPECGLDIDAWKTRMQY